MFDVSLLGGNDDSWRRREHMKLLGNEKGGTSEPIEEVNIKTRAAYKLFEGKCIIMNEKTLTLVHCVQDDIP
jgi:hypothetical protein